MRCFKNRVGKSHKLLFQADFAKSGYILGTRRRAQLHALQGKAVLLNQRFEVAAIGHEVTFKYLAGDHVLGKLSKFSHKVIRRQPLKSSSTSLTCDVYGVPKEACIFKLAHSMRSVQCTKTWGSRWS